MPDELLHRLREADPLGAGQPSPPTLDALGLTADRLDVVASSQSGAGHTDAEPARQRDARWRATGLSVVIALLVGTGTAAASLTALTGDPLGRTPKVDIEPAASTVRLASVRSADPDGGPAWGVRVGRAERGLVCLAAGQVEGGRIGLVGLDGVFRADRPRDADDCAVTPQRHRVLAHGRTYLGKTRTTSTWVIYGLAGRDITKVVLQYPDGTSERLPIGADRTFVAARRGTLSATRPSLVAAIRKPPAARFSETTLIDFGGQWKRLPREDLQPSGPPVASTFQPSDTPRRSQR